MKTRSNGPARAGSSAANASSAGRVDDRDPLVGDPRLAPPAAGEVGPLAVGIDGHDRAVGRLAERHPQRRVAVCRADLARSGAARPASTGQDAAGVAVEDRDVGRPGAAASIAASAGRQRAPRSTSIQSRSVSSGIQPRSLLPSVASYEQAGAEIEAGGQDRPGRDRADVDVQQAGRGFHRPGARGLDRGPARRRAGRPSPTMQPQPDEQRPRPDRAPRTGRVGRPGAGRDPGPRTGRAGPRPPRAGRGRSRIERRLGELGRHEVPVAEDHRREDAAGRRGSRRRAGPGAATADAVRRPSASAPKTSVATAAAQPPTASAAAARRRPRARDRRGRRRRARRTTRARRGAARPRRDRRRPARSPSAPAGRRRESQARTPKPTRTGRREAEVAAGRRRPPARAGRPPRTTRARARSGRSS